MRRGTHRALLYKRPAAVSAYEGPGDVQSGATHFWGVYAYNAAYATGSNPCIDITDQANANALTVNILSTGFVDVAAISAWVTANSVTTIKVSKVYDQIGSAHLEQATAADRPVLEMNQTSGGLPAFDSVDGLRWIYGPSSLAVAQPYSMTTVARRNGAAGAFQHVVGTFGGGAGGSIQFWVGEEVILQADSVVDCGVATDEGVFKSIQAVINGASSKGAVNGSVGSNVNVGGSSYNATTPSIFYPSAAMEGQVLSYGFYPSDVSSGFAALGANDVSLLGL
jgi:hypothetical protein